MRKDELDFEELTEIEKKRFRVLIIMGGTAIITFLIGLCMVLFALMLLNSK